MVNGVGPRYLSTQIRSLYRRRRLETCVQDPISNGSRICALSQLRNDIRVEQETVHNFTLRGLRFGLRNMRPSPTSGIVRMKSISDMAGISPTSDRRKIRRAFTSLER